MANIAPTELEVLQAEAATAVWPQVPDTAAAEAATVAAVWPQVPDTAAAEAWDDPWRRAAAAAAKALPLAAGPDTAAAEAKAKAEAAAGIFNEPLTVFNASAKKFAKNFQGKAQERAWNKFKNENKTNAKTKFKTALVSYLETRIQAPAGAGGSYFTNRVSATANTLRHGVGTATSAFTTGARSLVGSIKGAVSRKTRKGRKGRKTRKIHDGAGFFTNRVSATANTLRRGVGTATSAFTTGASSLVGSIKGAVSRKVARKYRR